MSAKNNTRASKANREAKQALPQTISNPLRSAWDRLKRKGDPQAMADKYGYSRVPFDNALKWGHIKTAAIATAINEYFKERLESEKALASEVNDLVAALDSKAHSE